MIHKFRTAAVAAVIAAAASCLPSFAAAHPTTSVESPFVCSPINGVADASSIFVTVVGVGPYVADLQCLKGGTSDAGVLIREFAGPVPVTSVSFDLSNNSTTCDANGGPWAIVDAYTRTGAQQFGIAPCCAGTAIPGAKPGYTRIAFSLNTLGLVGPATLQNYGVALFPNGNIDVNTAEHDQVNNLLINGRPAAQFAVKTLFNYCPFGPADPRLQWY